MPAVWSLIRQTVIEWFEDGALESGAALAYYAVFSLAPLMFILITVTGLVFEGDAAGQVRTQLGAIVGSTAADRIASIIERQQLERANPLATGLSVVMLIVTASGVFAALQRALNRIWGVAPLPGRGIVTVIRSRLLSVLMVATTAVLLLLSMVLGALVSFIASNPSSILPGTRLVAAVLNHPVVAGLTESGISAAILVVMFATVFKTLPDARIAWKDVWVGAAVTAGLFTAGKFALGVYLAHSAPGSAYGAAGSLIVVLAWVYYSAQTLFVGAEFTQVWARSRDRRIQPAEHAYRVQTPGGGTD